MAQEIALKVTATTAEAEANLKRLNSTLEEQNEILLLLEEELLRVQKAQEGLANAAFSPERDKLAKAEKNLKNEIKDQRLALKRLNAERRNTKTALDTLTSANVKETKIIQAIDKLTGGYATKIKKLYLGLIEGAKGVKIFSAGLSGLKKALIATGIGALVVALGVIIAYWDDIKTLINGVSSEQKKLLADTEGTRDAQQAQLDLLKAQENTLKLQGKTEKEIRDLKIQQTNEVIRATEAVLIQQQKQKEAQVEAAKRNKQIAQAAITALTLPLTLLLGAVDALTFGLKQIGVLSESTALAEGFTGGLAGLVFDPESVAEEGDKAIEETEKQLVKLKNTRDGYLLAEQKAENDARNKKLANQKQKDDEQRAYEEKVAADRLARLQKQINDELNLRLKGEEKVGAIRRQFFEKNLGDSLFADQKRLEFEKERVLRDIKESQASDAQKRMAKAEVTKFYDAEDERLVKEHEKRVSDIEKQAREKRLEEDAARRQANLDLTFNATAGILGAISQLNQIYDKDDAKAAKKSFERNKKLQTALTIVSTLQGAQQAFSSQVVPGDPSSYVRGIVAAGVALVQGYARVRTIQAQKFEAPQKAEPSTGGGGGSITTPQAPQFNIIGGGATNQLAGVLADQQSEPVRAYVVSNDVSTAQSLDRNIVESATLD